MSNDMYQEAILDHYRHPRNYGELTDPNARAREANMICGDTIEVQLKLDGDKLEDVKFRGQGCAISIAAASMLTETVKGKSINEITKLGESDIIRILGTDPGTARMECALLGLKVMKMAIYSHLGIEMPQEPEGA